MISPNAIGKTVSIRFTNGSNLLCRLISANKSVIKIIMKVNSRKKDDFDQIIQVDHEIEIPVDKIVSVEEMK